MRSGSNANGIASFGAELAWGAEGSEVLPLGALVERDLRSGSTDLHSVDRRDVLVNRAELA